MIISLLGGLAMFLYGMEIMGDGLKQGSGPALKNFLGKLTHNVVLGLLTGTIVTAIIQSSTATIVLTVGLIGAGILNLRQAVSIVMGANIFNMGVIGTLGGYAIYRALCGVLGGESRARIPAAAVAAWCSVVLGAISMSFIFLGSTSGAECTCRS